MRIIIPKKLLDVFYQVLEHAKEELVGFLLGMKLGNEVHVKEIILCENTERSRFSFKVNPYAILETYDIARRYELEVVALIHSHPAVPYPSGKDVLGMKLWNVVWIIVDSRSYDIRSWILVNDSLVEVELSLI